MRLPWRASQAANLSPSASRRVCQEIEWICSQHDEKDLVACVFHADPIKLAVAYYIGLPLDHFQRLSSAPASITTLLIGENSSHLVNLNVDFSLTMLPIPDSGILQPSPGRRAACPRKKSTFAR